MEAIVKFIITTLLVIGLALSAFFTADLARTIFTITAEGPINADSTSLFTR